MRELAQGFTIGGYLLAFVMAVGYAMLLISRPAERRIAFAAVWLIIAASLTAVLHFRIQPDLLQQFAEIAVDYHLEQRPGTRAVSRVDWNDFENARDAALLSAFVAPHALLLPDRGSQLDTNLTGFLERRYGPLRAKVLLNALAAPAPVDDPELCTALVMMVEYALALPAPDRADMIRLMFQEAASSPLAAEPPSDESAPITL